MKTRLLLIAEPGLARAAYMAVLHDQGVDVDCIGSPGEMAGALMDAPYSGLVIDVPTMIRCECGDKNRITRVMERFPVLRVMYNPKCGGIRGLAQGGTLRDNRDLGEFVTHECAPFTPRSIRVVQRREVVFNVILLNALGLPAERGERTVTLNVSEHGCFIYSISDWRMNTSAWLVVNEFDDRTPIELKVRWRRPWGTASLLPGIGATFESMTAYQYAQLHSFL